MITLPRPTREVVPRPTREVVRRQEVAARTSQAPQDPLPHDLTRPGRPASRPRRSGVGSVTMASAADLPPPAAVGPSVSPSATSAINKLVAALQSRPSSA
jgi:hypothetical protein